MFNVYVTLFRGYGWICFPVIQEDITALSTNNNRTTIPFLLFRTMNKVVSYFGLLSLSSPCVCAVLSYQHWLNSTLIHNKQSDTFRRIKMIFSLATFLIVHRYLFIVCGKNGSLIITLLPELFTPNVNTAHTRVVLFDSHRTILIPLRRVCVPLWLAARALFLLSLHYTM